MTIKKQLLDTLKNKIPGNLLKYVPSRYPILGRAVLLRISPKILPYAQTIGSALLEIMHNIDSVWAIINTVRTTREPIVMHLAGNPKPIITHKELGTQFIFDISRITFSPGNREERKRLLKIVERGSVILDMFACVGNLSLPLATNGIARRIFAVEINPYAYRFLVENILINRVTNIVIPLLRNNQFPLGRNFADHVLMGYLPEPNRYQLDVALEALKKVGMIHYHMLASKGNEEFSLENLVKIISQEYNYEILDATITIVKSFSPRLNHIVIRLKIKK